MTATLPSVVAADDLIVRSAPRNQRASPSSGWSAMTVGDASCASGVDMGASLPTRRPFVQRRRGTGVAACVSSLRRSVVERDLAPSDASYAEPVQLLQLSFGPPVALAPKHSVSPCASGCRQVAAR